jgi:hypothetical protein
VSKKWLHLPSFHDKKTKAFGLESQDHGRRKSLHSLKMGQYLEHEFHPAFQTLQINPTSFAPQWNRDFRVDSNCPKGEKRGGQPYYPPKGWVRFGLNVSGRFPDGDTWLGMTNCPGEWCVAYHGTHQQYVKSITESPLRTGRCNCYGRGIYCTPDISVASEYARTVQIQTPEGPKSYQYVFMCRVNCQSICQCSVRDANGYCVNDSNPAYTLHMTQCADWWFVNANNGNYQHIRTYGLLVRENSGS